MAKREKEKQQETYNYYGSKCKAEDIKLFLQHAIKVNFENVKQGLKSTPVCIWGKHGIGKTQLVNQLANEMGFEFAYIAPAQFEEMGDFIGLPSIENGKTKFMPPSWVPESSNPGILLIDDVNRADDRILRGIMQLLQNHEMMSWKLPDNWHIILTANPDGGDYSVTPMDDAMLTRMLHVTMEFDAKAWAKWAEKNGIDTRGIDFVLSYPEMVNGKRTTPRSLEQFFRQIAPIENFRDNLPLIKLLGESCFELETVTTFIKFTQETQFDVIQPEDLLNMRKEEMDRKLAIFSKDGLRRVDILNVISTRLTNYLVSNKVNLDERQVDNLMYFFQHHILPGDLKMIMAKDLVQSPNASVRSIFAKPQFSEIIFNTMEDPF
jgi:hypothetical protein